MNYHATGRDPLRPLMRNAAVQAIAAVTSRTVPDVAQSLYGVEGADVALKAAVTPAATGDWGGELAAGSVAAAFVGSLRGRSASTELFSRGQTLDLRGVGTAVVPRVLTDFPAPGWVGEGAPIPANRASFDTATITPKKLAALVGLTNELAELTPILWARTRRWSSSRRAACWQTMATSTATR